MVKDEKVTSEAKNKPEAQQKQYASAGDFLLGLIFGGLLSVMINLVWPKEDDKEA